MTSLQASTTELYDRMDAATRRADLLRQSHDRLYAALKALVEAKDEDQRKTALFKAMFAIGYADGFDSR